MLRIRSEHTAPAILALGFALVLPIVAIAQGPAGPGLSSGSGSGTGTGESSAIGRNDTGSISGVGPAQGLGNESGGLVPSTSGIPLMPPGESIPLGPGVMTTFPDDEGLFPFSVFLQESGQNTSGELSQVQPREIEFAESITDPAERSLTLIKVANVAIFGNQLHLAHRSLRDAVKASARVQDPKLHDLRMIAVINSLDSLAEAFLREGKMDLTLPEFDDLGDDSGDPPAIEEKKTLDRNSLIARAEHEWSHAAHVAGHITSPTYRSEMLYRVVESQAYGSQTILAEFPIVEAEADAEAAKSQSLEARARQLLAGSAEFAKRIDRPVWRDRALVAAATAGAQAKMFDEALKIARMIPQPEIRTDALVRIAEIQARRSDPDGATQTYHEAAEAVASIPLDDPRAILAGVLIDNLISVGRFDDARSVVTLYPDVARRMVALGAVAESQGFRGASKSAVEWIKQDVPEEYRPVLYRKLRFGTLSAIEQNRSRDLSGRGR